MRTNPVPEQIHPLKFFSLLRWLDGRPLLEVMEPYRQQIHTDFLYTFRADGSPRYKRGLKGRGKKNSKTADEVFENLYKLLTWKASGNKGNQCYFVASDLGQASDDLDLCKKLIRCNPILDAELTIKQNVIERKDGHGFIEILAAGDAPGLHGKTYLFLVVDELHTQRDYRVLEALELDRTRPDAVQSFASYASMSRAAGVPINDILKQHAAQSDPRLFVSWYAGSIEEANPSLNGPLGPTMADIEDAQRSLPSWIFRRLYQNLPGQPDGAAFDASTVEAATVKGRAVLSPQPGLIYHKFIDFGAGGEDDSTVAIAHATSDGRQVLDLVLDQGARDGKTYSPEHAVQKFAAIVEQYGGSPVTGDNFAKLWPQQALLKHGITYHVSPQTRSQLYAALEPLLNSGQVELLDQPKLFSQLIGLVRRGDKIDHPGGEHDDWANAAAGALVLAAQHAHRVPFAFFSGGRFISSAPAVARVSDAVTAMVEQVGETLGHAAKALDKAMTPSPPRPRPAPVRRKSIQEIQSLSEGCRTVEEQERLDQHYAQQRNHRQPSELEQRVMKYGPYWPGDLPNTADPGDLNAVMEQVRRTFAQWR